MLAENWGSHYPIRRPRELLLSSMLVKSLVVEAVIEKTVHETNGDDDLISCLEWHARSSRTAKLWVDELIKPVFPMMLFCGAEKEANWPLHLRAVSIMIPYFFAAGHHMPVMVCITYDHQKQCQKTYVGNLSKENMSPAILPELGTGCGQTR